MQSELEQQLVKKEQTLKHLSELLPKLFSQMKSQTQQDMCNQFVELCLYPRIMNSPKDALYSFHFLKLLCKLRVPNFNVLFILSAILKGIVPMMHCCSESEAESLGIFFSELFNLLNHWCKRVNWTNECAGNLAFCKNFNSDECITFEDFSDKIVENFGKRFAQSLMLCIEKDPKMYMKARCSLVILYRMSSVYPNSFMIANSIQVNRLQKLVDAEGEIQHDLWTLAC